MTTRTWIGGGNNQATNPSDWSPSGAPQPGDTLSIASGTMNIFGNALAGDNLTVVSGNADLNLFNAFANIAVGLHTLDAPVASPVIDLSGFDEMTYTGFNSDGTINLKAGAVFSIDLLTEDHGMLPFGGVAQPASG